MTFRMNRVLASAVIAVVLAGTGFAAPAQAAPPGGFNLTFDFGNRPPPPPPPPERACMSKGEIVRALRNSGYRDASVVRNLGKGRVLAVGRKASKWYQLRIDTCSGFVDNVRRIRRDGDGSFEFYLNFDGDNLPPREDLVCLVTYFDESDVARGDEDDVESAELMRRSEAEDIDRPRDRRDIFDYGSDRENRQSCEYLNSINN
jgi:hypothetical protein